MFFFKPVEVGDDVDQNAFPNLNFWAGGFVGEDGRGGFVYLASSTCQNFWLVSYDYASYNGKKGQCPENVPTSKWKSQVNQQNHMVANKFDPRMDPVVVQVIQIIALK